MKSSIWLRFLLVFALLLAQLGGLAHGIAHAAPEQAQDQSLPHDKHCELCAIYAQLGSAIGSCSPGLAGNTGGETDYLGHCIPRFHDTLVVFAARAPPCSA